MYEDAPPKQSDDELALGIACGEKDAISEIIRLHGPAVRNMLMRKYERVWEDAWHDALVRLVNRIDTFDSSKGSLKSWFTKIAQNCAIDIFRAAKNHVTLESDIDGGIDIVKAQPTPMTAKKRKAAANRKELICAAVDALPEKQRRIILADLAHPEGKAPARELAENWGTTANAIHQARDRAKKQLRIALVIKNIYCEDQSS